MADPVVKFTDTTSMTIATIVDVQVLYDRDPNIDAVHVVLTLQTGDREIEVTKEHNNFEHRPGTYKEKQILRGLTTRHSIGTWAQRDLIALALGVDLSALGVDLSAMAVAEVVKTMKSFDWKKVKGTRCWVETTGQSLAYLGWCKEG